MLILNLNANYYKKRLKFKTLIIFGHLHLPLVTCVTTIYKWPATATEHNFLCLAVLSLLRRYKKNCKKNAKCFCDR